MTTTTGHGWDGCRASVRRVRIIIDLFARGPVSEPAESIDDTNDNIIIAPDQNNTFFLS